MLISMQSHNYEKTFSIFVNLIRNSNDDYIVNIFDDKNITINTLKYTNVNFTKKRTELYLEVKNIFMIKLLYLLSNCFFIIIN